MPIRWAEKLVCRTVIKLFSVDNKPNENFNAIPVDIILGKTKSLQIDRNGQRLNINIPPSLITELNANKANGLMEVRFPVIVDSVDKNKAHFLQNSLQKGDTLIALNGKHFSYFNQFDSMKQAYKKQAVVLTALRGKDTVTVKAQLNETASVGFLPVSKASDLFTTVEHRYFVS